MDHDVKAVANVFYKLARADGKRPTAAEYQYCAWLAQELSKKTLGEKLFNDRIEFVGFTSRPYIAALHQAFGEGEVTRRLETRTRPIKEETPEWKVIRAAWMQFDYEQRHGTAASDVTARQAGT